MQKHQKHFVMRHPIYRSLLIFFCFYSIIKKHGNVLDIYSKQLIDEGIVTREEVTEVIDKYEKICEEAYKKAGTEKQVRICVNTFP